MIVHILCGVVFLIGLLFACAGDDAVGTDESPLCAAFFENLCSIIPKQSI